MAPSLSLREPVFEDEEDWLNGYLATTKYSNDEKIMSKPVKQVKQVKQVKEQSTTQKRRYSLQTKLKRSSSGCLPPVQSLPDRVNSIRDGSNGGSGIKGGHFVRGEREREARGERIPGRGRRISTCRRESIDFDDLDAVKLRLMQATSAYLLRQEARGNHSSI